MAIDRSGTNDKTRPAEALLAFKVKVALAATKGEFRVDEAVRCPPPTRSIAWKTQALEGPTAAFGGDSGAAELPFDLKEFHARIGKLTLQNDFVRCARQGWTAERKAMINRSYELACDSA